MNEDLEKTARIRRYLLGQASEEEAEQVEQMLLTDQHELEQVQILQEELSDEYLQGVLSEDERPGFEARYLVNEDGRRTVRFARVFGEYVREQMFQRDTAPKSKRSWSIQRLRIKSNTAGRFAVWAGCMATVLFAANLFLVRRTWVLSTKLDQEQKMNDHTSKASAERGDQFLAKRENQNDRGDRLEKPAGATATDEMAIIETIVLAPGLSRGTGTIPIVSLRSSTELIEVDLRVLAGSHDEYRAVLYDSRGREIAMQGLLKRINAKGGTMVPLRLAATGLVSGDYKIELEVSDGEAQFGILGTYYLRINRRHEP